MDIMEKLLVRYNAAFDCHCVINLSELPGNLPFIELNRIIFSLYAGEEVQVYWPLHSVFLSGPLRLCDHHGHCHIALPDVDSTRRVILILQRIMIGSTPCRARVALTPLVNITKRYSLYQRPESLISTREILTRNPPFRQVIIQTVILRYVTVCT